jgi:uncharacterized membrane protein
MIRTIYYLVVCGLFFTACNNSGSETKNESDTTNAATPVVDSFALARAGIYQGYLPCADCRGISTFLQLKPDMTFRLEETYHKKVDSLHLTNGKWKTENGKIILQSGNETLNSYLPEGEKLWQLDYQGNRISGNLGDRYMLTRQPQVDNSHLKEKADAGIDFIANGNEPFWSLEIDKGKNIIFNQPGLENPDSIGYAEPVVNNGTREYHIQSGTKTIDVKILPQFCSDGMSDFVYEYKVELQYNKKKYSGCGRLVGSL